MVETHNTVNRHLEPYATNLVAAGSSFMILPRTNR